MATTLINSSAKMAMSMAAPESCGGFGPGAGCFLLMRCDSLVRRIRPVTSAGQFHQLQSLRLHIFVRSFDNQGYIDVADILWRVITSGERAGLRTRRRAASVLKDGDGSDGKHRRILRLNLTEERVRNIVHHVFDKRCHQS